MAGFVLLDQDKAYADQASFNDHVQALLNPPVPADQAERAPAVSLEPGAGSTSPSLPAPMAPVTAPLVAPPSTQQPVTGPAERTSQFGLGLSSGDAYAACGPAAAIAFANTYGRNPTAAEAMSLARQVGWTPDLGMAGVSSEQSLLSKMGVATKLEQGVDWNHVAADANGGNPVIIDTPGHYFYVTGARQGPNGQEFNVGTSGTDLRGGGAWMTPAQMGARMGAPRAALYADNPTSPTPSVANTQPSAVTGGGATTPGGLPATSAQAPVALAGQQPAPGSPALDQFGDHVRSITNGAVDLGGQAMGAVKDDVSAFNDHVKAITGGLVDLSGNPQSAGIATPQPSAPTGIAPAVTPGGLPSASSGMPDVSPPPPPPPSQPGPLDIVKQKFSDALDAFGGLLSNVGGPSPTRAQMQAEIAAAPPLSIAPDPLSFAGSSLGAPTGGEQMTAQRNQEIAENNPLRDVPFAGGASTMAAQMVTDPTNLMLAGAGGTRALANPVVRDALGAFARSRLPAEADANFAAGGLPGLLGRLAQYPEETRQGLEDFVATQSKAGQTPEAIGDTVVKWMQDNPPPVVTDVAAAPSGTQAALAPTSPTAAVASGFQAPVGPDALPASLAKSNPRYAIGANQFQLNFASDTDKALYVVAQKTPSKADEKFMDFLRNQFPDKSDAEIRQMGAGVRSEIKTAALSGDPSEPLQVASSATQAAARSGVAKAGPPSAFQAPTTATGGAGGQPPIESPPVAVATPPPPGPRQIAPVTKDQVAPQGPLSNVVSAVNSAFQPMENLPPGEVKDALQHYAAVVGQQSQGARVVADTAGHNIAEGIPQFSQAGLPVESAGAAQSAAEAQARADLNGVLQSNGLSESTPEIAAILRNITSRSAIAANPLGAAALGANTAIKGSLFGLSNLHNYTEAVNAVVSGGLEAAANYVRAFVSPSFYDGVRYGTLAPDFNRAAMAGVTGLLRGGGGSDVYQIANIATRAVIGAVGGAGAGYEESLRAGDTQNALRNAGIGALAGAGAGVAAPALFSSLFGRAVPLAKVTVFKQLTDGGMPELQAASAVNRTFGGLNYAQMGRSQTLQDAMRFLMTAPDWNESTVRQLGSAVTGGKGGDYSRGLLAKAIAGSMISSEILSYALNGKSTFENEPGHQLEVQVGTDKNNRGVYMGFMPGNIQAYGNLIDKIVGAPGAINADLTQFAQGRAGVIPQMAARLSGSEWLGGPKAKNELASVASTAAPIGVASVAQGLERGVSWGNVIASLLAGPNLRYGSKAGQQATRSPIFGFQAPTTKTPAKSGQYHP